MSKKTKRLEKENLNLTRKHDLTNRNILEMAEERQRTDKELERLRKTNKKLEDTVRMMQQQGRGQGLVGDMEGDDEDTQSEYDDEYDEEDDEDGSDDGDLEREIEAELSAQAGLDPKPIFGPVPPPPPSQPIANGVNGINH